MAKINGIHHVNLRPSRNDYDACLKFYCEDLGLDIVNSWQKDRGDFVSRNCYVGIGSQILLEICETAVENKKAGPIQHIAFAVSDCNSLLQELKDKGYAIVNSKGLPSDSLSIDVSVGDPLISCRTGFVLSPSGELVEFVQDF